MNPNFGLSFCIRDLKTAFRKLARQWHPVLDFAVIGFRFCSATVPLTDDLGEN